MERETCEVSQAKKLGAPSSFKVKVGWNYDMLSESQLSCEFDTAEPDFRDINFQTWNSLRACEQCSRKIFIKVWKVLWKRTRQKVWISELGVEGCGMWIYQQNVNLSKLIGNCYNTFKCIHSC